MADEDCLSICDEHGFFKCPHCGCCFCCSSDLKVHLEVWKNHVVDDFKRAHLKLESYSRVDEL